MFKRIWHGVQKLGRPVAKIAQVAAAGFGISTEPEALINLGVGFVLKKGIRKYPNWAIPAANVVVATGVALAQGMTPEQAVTAGMLRTVIATGTHSAIKNPVKVTTGRSI